ncbi:hypothetical protein A1Q2_00354 [Trichosporon asahii var. asahii CBS 8904]|uniref:Uncharacterized protein n=2 Tax=Trichosporon asahii var. asahii TaxID=189963 RepID=K1VME3_TRIAC|nr:hypothetical protein A1Q1_06283 [Trichosporon asahii var. asahii CBS 2479]EJT52177.1 hypothetical protein A1Q1_06283 [Trichosporon asahii var. asahii CBS 2479]EKD05345.1 hypothetical protein A1Q2_00354 [Trichosporon asahii var. asahii CBS 8904]
MTSAEKPLPRRKAKRVSVRGKGSVYPKGLSAPIDHAQPNSNASPSDTPNVSIDDKATAANPPSSSTTKLRVPATQEPFVFGSGATAAFHPPEPPLSDAALQAIEDRVDSRVRSQHKSLQTALGFQINARLSAGLDRLKTAAREEVRLRSLATLNSLRGDQHKAQQVLLLQAEAQVSAARAHLTNWLQDEIQSLCSAQKAEVIKRDTAYAELIRELRDEMEALAGSVDAVSRAERAAMKDELKDELRAEIKEQLKAELMNELRAELRGELATQHVQLGARLMAELAPALREADGEIPKLEPPARSTNYPPNKPASKDQADLSSTLLARHLNSMPPPASAARHPQVNTDNQCRSPKERLAAIVKALADGTLDDETPSHSASTMQGSTPGAFFGQPGLQALRQSAYDSSDWDSD